MAERETHYHSRPTYPMRSIHITNTAFYTYATMVCPAHNDIEIITEILCRFIPSDRIAVHAQTVVVTALTQRESSQIAMLDLPMSDGANLLSTDLPGSIIPAGF